MKEDRRKTYEEIRSELVWDLPEHYNAAFDVCDRHADRPNSALILDVDGAPQAHSFAALRSAANRFANLLVSRGMKTGDVVALVAQPAFEIPVTHIGCWKAGVVSCPIATLFASDALQYRFSSGAVRLVVTDHDNEAKVREAAHACSSAIDVLVFGGASDCAGDFWQALSEMPETFENVRTQPDSPLSLNFTSGTTGQPKGVIAPHSHVPGQAAAMEFLYNYPQPGDVMWSPADWAWLAGQMCTLMAGLFLGMTVIGRPRAGFDADDAFRLLSEHQVTHTLLIPTMMKRMRQVALEDQRRPELCVRVVATGGEPCGPELYRWVREVFDAPLNETFGQTECATMICNNRDVNAAPFGCLGKPTPGLDAAILRPDGTEADPDEIGEIAARMPHPIIFLEYLGDPQATAAKKRGEWMFTGDLGRRDDDGNFWYVGRADDVITSSGYRIGPSEVEDALLTHPAVEIAAVVGLPDPDRTEIVVAFVKLTDSVNASERLQGELRDHVRDKLARHEVPRRIEFIDAMPVTATGKVMRKTLREQALARVAD